MSRVSKGPHLARRDNRAGTYYIVVPDGRGGKQRHSTGTKDYGEAVQALGVFLNEIGSPKAPSPPIALLTEQYLDEHAVHLPSEDTQRFNVDNVLRILPQGLTLAQLKPSHITAFVQKRQEEGVARATINRDLSALRASLNHARKAGRIGDVPHIINLRLARKRPRVLTLRETRQLFDACRSDHMRAYIMLALWTGARPHHIKLLT